MRSSHQKLYVIALGLQGISILCSIAFFFVALLWVLKEPFWFLDQSNFEPITVVLGLMAAFTASLSRYFKARRSRGESSQIPISQHPTIWLTTDHSKARIDYVPVRNRDRENEINEVLRKHYSAYVGRIYRVDLVDEVSGSLNHRVKGVGRKPVLLRIHKRITSESALEILQVIQRHIFESGIFSDSPFNDCLIPLPSSSGNRYEQLKGQLVEVYPFADNVEHYSGKSLAQLRGLAEKYGLVQKALRKLDPSIDVTQLNYTHPYVSWFGADKSLFNLICQNNNRAIKANPDRLTVVFNQYQDLLRKIWREVKPYLACIQVHSEPLLHDFHPHNTFFRNDRCVLIFDYEATSRYWSETEALAFAIHRFIREYIRSLRDRGHPAAEAEIPKVVDTFLEHYSLGGMSVSPDFKDNLSLEIKITNLAKLLLIMSYQYRISDDPARRSEDVWYAELVKFISHLQEAEYFDLKKPSYC